MCELLAVAAEGDFLLSPVLDWARRLETMGFAGYGWGVAWVSGQGLDYYKHPGSLADDTAGAQHLANTRVRRALIHLRRPTDPTTVTIADTQPFVDEARTFAFCHNGNFKLHQSYRSELRDKLSGRADTEVGFQLLRQSLAEGNSPADSLVGILTKLQGYANCGYLQRDGELFIYHANPGNPCWSATLQDGLRVLLTGLHWPSRTGIDLVFPGLGAAERISPGVTKFARALAEA
jgi:predicted glutamine amidotransferase